MPVYRAGSQPRSAAPQQYFTGEVHFEPIETTPAPAALRSLLVHFAAGARTHWHTHPLGQTLFVVSGRGRVQEQGGPVREVGPGDVVWFPPGVLHWHGAAPDAEMSHLAMQQANADGEAVDWGEAVGDADYMVAPNP